MAPRTSACSKSPAVAKYGSMAFVEAEGIIALGVVEAKNKKEVLVQWSGGCHPERSEGPPSREPRGVLRFAQDDTRPPIDYVEIEGSERVDPRVVRTRPGEPLDGERLRADVARLYGLDDFQSVTFNVQDRYMTVGKTF